MRHSDITGAKSFPEKLECLNIVHMANVISGNSKGHKTLIEVVKRLVENGVNVKVKFIGDGPSVQEFKDYAKDIGVDKNIEFTGRISERSKLLYEVRQGDIFVFPSYSEGLPRCIIEACAVGCPCLSTPVGGIVELLEEEYLFAPDDVEGFANKIVELVNNPAKLNCMSETNIAKAQKYEKTILDARRKGFYEKLYNLAKNNIEK